MAIWVGPRAGIDGVQEFYGAHTAFSIDTFPEKINELLSEVEDIYYGFGSDQIVDEVITNYLISRQKNNFFRLTLLFIFPVGLYFYIPQLSNLFSMKIVGVLSSVQLLSLIHI